MMFVIQETVKQLNQDIDEGKITLEEAAFQMYERGYISQPDIEEAVALLGRE